jgi:ABC-2 type transport system permease protein
MAAEASVAGSPPAPRMGWRIVAGKELADHLLSRRFTIGLLLVGLAALVVVYTGASDIKERAQSATEVEALFIRLYTFGPDQFRTFFGLVGLLAPLFGIAFGFDAVSSERSEGTLPRLLSQPIHRDDVINGKFAAGLSVIAIMLTILTFMVAGVGILRLGIVPGLEEVGRILVYLLLAILYAGFWLAFSMLVSVVLRRASTAAIAAIGAWLVFALLAGYLFGIIADIVAPIPENPTVAQLDEVVNKVQFRQNLQRISPTFLYLESTIVLLNPDVTTLGIEAQFRQQFEPAALPSSLSLDQSILIVWPQIVILVGLTAICFAGAYIAFMRQEIRA